MRQSHPGTTLQKQGASRPAATPRSWLGGPHSARLCISASTWPQLSQVYLLQRAPHLLINLLPIHSSQICSLEFPRAQPADVFQLLVACYH